MSTTSAQGLFNLLTLRLGDLAAKWLFIPLQASLMHNGAVDFQKLFLVPSSLALLAAGLLLVGFDLPASLDAEEGAVVIS